MMKVRLISSIGSEPFLTLIAENMGGFCMMSPKNSDVTSLSASSLMCSQGNLSHTYIIQPTIHPPTHPPTQPPSQPPTPKNDSQIQ